MSTDTPPAAPTPPSSGDQFFDSIRRAGIVRSDERWLGGVAGGLSLRVGVDPLVGRAVMVLAAFLGGIGLIAYGVGWALLPEQRDGRIHLQELFRGNFDAAIVGAILVTLTGLGSSGAWGAPWWPWWGGGGWSGLVGLIVVGLVIAVIVSAVRDSRSTSPPPPPPVSQPAPPTDASRPPGTPMSPETPTGSAGTSDPAPGATYPYGGQTPATAYTSAPSRPTTTSPVPQSPPRPVVRGAGATATAVVVGLGLLTVAVLMLAERYGVWDGPLLLTAGAVTVVLAGLGIVIAGIRGRSSGGLGAIAVLATLMLLPMAAVQGTTWSWEGDTTGLGDLRRTPSAIVEAERGYTVGAGQVHLDLADLPLDRDGNLGDIVHVPVSVGAGEAVVTMPRDEAYTATIRVFAGEIRWLGDHVRGGVGNQSTDLESDAVRNGAEPRLHLDITVGAGNATVVEARR